jgi:hypothetical protein
MAAAACGGVRWQRCRRVDRGAVRAGFRGGIHPRARPSARRAVPHDPHARARIDRPTVEVYSLDWPRARVARAGTASARRRGGDRSGVATRVAAGGLPALAAALVRRARRRRAPPVPRTG